MRNYSTEYKGYTIIRREGRMLPFTVCFGDDDESYEDYSTIDQARAAVSQFLNEEEQEDNLNSLIAEYEAWNKSQGLNLGSADEHHDDPRLTQAQQQWLREFSRRWDKTAESEE